MWNIEELGVTQQRLLTLTQKKDYIWKGFVKCKVKYEKHQSVDMFCQLDGQIEAETKT